MIRSTSTKLIIIAASCGFYPDIVKIGFRTDRYKILRIIEQTKFFTKQYVVAHRQTKTDEIGVYKIQSLDKTVIAEILSSHLFGFRWVYFSRNMLLHNKQWLLLRIHLPIGNMETLKNDRLL